MPSEHQITDDIVYNLISIQYHALKGAEVYAKFLEDTPAGEHSDVTEFIDQCKRANEERAIRCHELLKELTV